MNHMGNPNIGQGNTGDVGSKRPRGQTYNNEALSGFGGVGPFGQNTNLGPNQYAQDANGYGGFYQENPGNPGMQNQNLGSHVPNFNQNPGNQNFGNFNPGFANQNSNMMNPNLMNPNLVYQNVGNQNNVGMGYGGPVNRNYIHGYSRGNSRKEGSRPLLARQRVLVKEPEPVPEPKVDYPAMIEKLKPTAIYDVTEMLRNLEIEPTEEWHKYMEPFAIYVAQQFLIIATKAVKIQPKRTISQESALFMTDDEFEKFLSEASFRQPPQKNAKQGDDIPKEKPLHWDKF